MKALVSVIIPVFNGERHIVPAIESVLAQTYSDTEIIVVDDISEDNTVAVVEQRFGPRVQLLRKPQRVGGGPGGRNLGILASSGQYLTFLDHDDLFLPEKLELQMDHLHQHPELDLVLGHMQNFFDDELSPEEQAGILSPMHPLPGVTHGTMLIRRASFDRVGPFNESGEMGDFLDWYGRAQLAGLQMFTLPQVVMRRRLHKTNNSRVNKQDRHRFLSTLKQILDARRNAAANSETAT